MADAALGPHRRTPSELQAVLQTQRDGAAFLEYRDGEGGHRIVVLDAAAERLSVGRLDACEIALPWDDEVSRGHALLERVGGAWTVEDRGSSNGTSVNASRINGPMLTNARWTGCWRHHIMPNGGRGRGWMPRAMLTPTALKKTNRAMSGFIAIG